MNVVCKLTVILIRFIIESEQSYERTQMISSFIEPASLKIKAPLPGTICDVFVEVNQEVKKGETLFLLEAMKMQNEIISTSDGIVTNINIKKSESVLKEQVLLEIE